jgi:hypothetical protein
VRPSYNIIEIRDHSNVRILRKEPYVDAEMVGDYRGLHQHVCGWRPDTASEDTQVVEAES